HYRQRDPHSRNYDARERHHDRRDNDWNDLRRHNPWDHRAVTTLPARDFGNNRARLRPADDAVARRVIFADPLRTDLPVRPALPGHERATIGERPIDRAMLTRPADIGVRPTGATMRRPGVALDEELRRSRIFNGRGPQPDIPN